MGRRGRRISIEPVTEHETLPDRDLSGWPEDGPDGFDFDDDAVWGDYPTRRTPPPPAIPWYRSPGMLLLLIGLAAAVLVIAAALLVTGRQSGKIPARPRLETRTSAPVPQIRASSTAPRTSSSPPSTSQAAEESAESGIEEVTPEPAEPSPSAAPPPATRSPQGPRINVTRTPMSFTPGKPG